MSCHRPVVMYLAPPVVLPGLCLHCKSKGASDQACYRVAGKFCERKFQDNGHNPRLRILDFVILFKIRLVPFREGTFLEVQTS